MHNSPLKVLPLFVYAARTIHETPFLTAKGGPMAIDPDLYEKISGRRPNDSAYGSAMLAAGKSNNPGMSTWEARARGRKWLAVASGLLAAGAVTYFLIFGI